jgi:glucose/arabinose dehydrogenase/mono/diheme cytochrome c family protein
MIMKKYELLYYLVLVFGFNIFFAATLHSQTTQERAPENENTWNTPQEELNTFDVRDGFEINLFASEPDVINPIAIQFDTRGRLWVVSSPDYPQIRPGNFPKGKIVILEDTNGDGVSDTSIVFADNILLPNGLALTKKGVYVASGTEILHLIDTTGDDKADLQEVVLTGFGAGDSHTNLNNLQWSHEGSLYMSQGLHSHHSRILTNQGLVELHRDGQWRWRPNTNNLEPFFGNMTGGFNPWGTTFDKWGQPFFISGGGGPLNGINWMKPGLTASEGHAQLRGAWPSREIRERSNLSGLEYISGVHLPEELQGAMVGGGFLTGHHDVPIFAIRDDSSGYAVDLLEPSLVTSSSRTFRPVDVKQGPDGAIYIVDFTQKIIGHYEYSLRDPRRDYSRGRIWRIAPTEKELPEVLNFEIMDVIELLSILKSDNHYERYQARRVLSTRDRDTVINNVNRWINEMDENTPRFANFLVEALGVHASQEHLERELFDKALTHSSHQIRSFATYLSAIFKDNIENVGDLLIQLAEDEHPRVRLETIVAASHFINLEREKAIEIKEKVERQETDYFLEYALNQFDLALDMLQPQDELSVLDGQQIDEPLYVRGANLFYICGACHGQEAEGITGEGSSLLGSEWVNGNPDNLIRIVIDGFRRTQAEDEEYPPGLMPPHSHISDEELAAILTFIRQLPENNTSAIQPNQVRDIREASEERNRIWSPEELIEIEHSEIE